MPRYFFNIHDGDHFTPDHVGMELEDNRSKAGSADIVKDEAGRELLRTTLSLASEGRLATVLL